MNRLSKIAAIIIIIFNGVYFLKATYQVIVEVIGIWSSGSFIFPRSLLFNLLLIPAFLTFTPNYQKNLLIQIMNLFGALLTLVVVYMLLTTPLIH